MSSEERDRVSKVAMVGGPALAVLGVMAGLPQVVWLPLAAAGGLAAWYRRGGRHYRSLAEDVEAAFPSMTLLRVDERPQPGGVLLVLTPAPLFTDAQVRAVVAGPAAGHGYKIASIHRAKRGQVTVMLIELVPS